MFSRSSIHAVLWTLTSIVFIGFLLFLFSHICFGYDEYLWKTMYERMGFTGFFHHIYESISFRFSTHFYLYLTFNFSGPETYRLFAFCSQLSMIALLIASVYSVLTTVFTEWLHMAVSRLRLLVYSLLMCASLYFLTSQIVEIYTYTSSFYSYFMPIAFFCFALGLVLKKNTGLLQWPGLFVAAFSLGGSSENVSASFIACMAVFILAAVLRNRSSLRILLSDVRIKKLLVFFALTSLFALIAYTAPGARNRATQEANNLLLKSNAVFAPQQLPVFISKFFHASNLIGVALLTWLVYAGAQIRNGKKVLVKKILLWSLATFAVSLLVHLLVTKIIFDSYGYLRIWFPVNFHLCLLLAAFLLYAGSRIGTLPAFATSLFAAGACFAFLLVYTCRHSSRISAFSEAYYARRTEIMQQCAASDTNLIYTSKPLPADPDILYYDKFVRFQKDSLSAYFCIFNEIPCKNVYVK